MNDESLKFAAQVVKYCAFLATTLLAVRALTRETVIKSANPLERNRLTPAGKQYRIGLVVIAILTLLAAITENCADSRIKKAAEKRGNEAFVTALQEQNRQLVGRLKPELEDVKTRLQAASHEHCKTSRQN